MLEEQKDNAINISGKQGKNVEPLLQQEEKISELLRGPDIETQLYAAKYRRIATDSWSAIGTLPNFLFPNDLPPELWQKLCNLHGNRVTALGELGENLVQRCLSIRQTKEEIDTLTTQEQARRFTSEALPLLEAAQCFVRKAGGLIPHIRSQLPKYAKSMFGRMIQEVPGGNDHLFDSPFKTFHTLNAGLIAFTIPESEAGTVFNLSGFLATYRMAKGNSPKGSGEQEVVEQAAVDKGEENHFGDNRDGVEPTSSDIWVMAPPLRTTGIMIEVLDEIDSLSERVKKRIAHELSQGEWDLNDLSSLPSQQQDLFHLLTTNSLMKLETVDGATLQASLSIPLTSPQIALEVAQELSTICSKYSQVADSICGTFSTDSKADVEKTDHIRLWLKIAFKESMEEGDGVIAFFSKPPQVEAIHPFSELSEALLRVPSNGSAYRMLLIQSTQNQVHGVSSDVQSQIDQLISCSNTFSLACISASSREQGDEQEGKSSASLRIHLLETKSFKELGEYQLETQVAGTLVRQRLLYRFGIESAYRVPQTGSLYRTPPFLSIQAEMLCEQEISLELQSLLRRIGVGTLDLTLNDKQFILDTLKSLSDIADKITDALPHGNDAKEYRLSYTPPQMVLVQMGRVIPVPANVVIEDPSGHVLYSGELNGVSEHNSIFMIIRNMQVLKSISEVFIDACTESFRQFENLDVAFMYNHLSLHRVRITKSLFDTMYELAKSFEVLELEGLSADRLFSQLVSQTEWKNIFEVGQREDGIRLLYQSDRPMKDRKIYDGLELP